MTTLRSVIEILTSQPIDKWGSVLACASAQSSFAADALWEAICSSRSAGAAIAAWLGMPPSSPEQLAEAWRQRGWQLARERQNCVFVCKAMERHQLTPASMEEVSAEIRAMVQAPIPDLDRRRLTDLIEISDAAFGYCSASDFEEKERQYWVVTTHAKSFCEQIRDAPTQVSHDGFARLAEHLRLLIEEDYAALAESSKAELDLHLLVDEYFGFHGGPVRLQVRVSNRPGCSPASDVYLFVGPHDSPYLANGQVEAEITPTLRGGASKEEIILLPLSNRAATERAFPVKARTRYRNRSGEECWTGERDWTVRLYPETEFEPIENPYAPYAEGGEVADPEMFFGRDEILTRVEAGLVAGAGGKCIVMFGQKRAGKSSLLAHLKRRFSSRGECMPVKFSLQEVAPRLDEGALLYRILTAIAEALEEIRSLGMTVPEFTCPTIEQMQVHPTLQFHDAMARLTRRLRRDGTTARTSIVLLIDEFTDIYKQIRKGMIPCEFMKAWKAIVEKRYFSSVLVGQDIMPAFKAEFPNEFGVTEDLRVTYLTDVAARRLVERPIGPQRFAGRAVERILDLTAGSPYYTMMLCSRLVDYMNRTRSAVVTEADINNVGREMLKGDRRLTRDKFDNLICAGDGVVDSGIDPEETLRLCLAISQRADRGWCTRGILKDLSVENLDALLNDVEQRDVAERKGDAYRIRVGLFQEWLRGQA